MQQNSGRNFVLVHSCTYLLTPIVLQGKNSVIVNITLCTGEFIVIFIIDPPYLICKSSNNCWSFLTDIGQIKYFDISFSEIIVAAMGKRGKIALVKHWVHVLYTVQ